jgi:alkylated DNA repair dioxygenase AlkB
MSPTLPSHGDSAFGGGNQESSIPEDPSPVLPPEGFSISSDVVPEEAWEQIRSYLGLSTSPRSFEQRSPNRAENDDKPSLRIHGFDDHGGGHINHQEDTTAETKTTSKKIPWESTPFPQNRPVAQFGFQYDYDKDVVVPPSNEPKNEGDNEGVPKIPELFHRLLLRPYQESMETKLGYSSSSSEFTQCIVNVYRPFTIVTVANGSKATAGTTTTTGCSSIPWHVDDPEFGPEILVFTFGETRPLHMRLKHDDSSNECNADGESRGCDDDFGDEGFSYFTARPAHRSCYVLSGKARHQWQHSVPSGSGWRVSITFRTLGTQ